MGVEAEPLAGPGIAERDWRWALKTAIPFLLFGFICAMPLYRVWFRWTDDNDYYSHGPLVPFISAYLVLRKRKELTGEAPPELGNLYAGLVGAGVLYYLFTDMGWDKRWLFGILCAAAAAFLVHYLRNLKAEPWRAGLYILIPALILCVISGVHEIVSLGWFFCVIATVGLVLYYLGRRVALIIAFPLVFLFSAVPLPEYIVSRATMPLKKFATANAAVVMRSRLVGITCERQGARIIMAGRGDEPTKELTIGAVCSGLRSLIALIAFGLLFAYITPLSLTKKIILFLATIPASFIANLFRILALGLITYWWDAEMAAGQGLWKALLGTWFSWLVPKLKKLSVEPVHDVVGIGVFIIAFIALFSLERVLTAIERRQRLAAQARAAAAEAPAPEEPTDA